jgi:hypothetical protein
VWSLADSTVNAYSGMGALAWSYTSKFNQDNASEESYSTDALANAYGSTHLNHTTKAEEGFYELATSHFEPHTGRLLWDQRTSGTAATVAVENTTDSRFDRAGNRYLYAQIRPVTYAGVTAPAKLQELTWSFYGADDKLRVMDRRSCVYGGVYGTGTFIIRGLIDGAPETSCLPPEWTDRPTWEEYRYDALGRRVLTRSGQTGWACESRCVNGVTRTVWDGDQILAEIRAPIATAEQDTGRVPPVTLFDHGYGQVLYTHGPSLDHPLKVTRLSYDSVFPSPLWITPHTNWQGSYDSGEVINSDNTGTCHKVSSGCMTTRPPPASTCPVSTPRPRRRIWSPRRSAACPPTAARPLSPGTEAGVPCRRGCARAAAARPAVRPCSAPVCEPGRPTSRPGLEVAALVVGMAGFETLTTCPKSHKPSHSSSSDRGASIERCVVADGLSGPAPTGAEAVPRRVGEGNAGRR